MKTLWTWLSGKKRNFAILGLLLVQALPSVAKYLGIDSPEFQDILKKLLYILDAVGVTGVVHGWMKERQSAQPKGTQV